MRTLPSEATPMADDRPLGPVANGLRRKGVAAVCQSLALVLFVVVSSAEAQTRSDCLSAVEEASSRANTALASESAEAEIMRLTLASLSSGPKSGGQQLRLVERYKESAIEVRATTQALLD